MSTSLMTKWPDHFPSGCPPASAIAAAGEVFRLVASDPPVARDFASHYFLYPDNSWGAHECSACGLSVHDSLDNSKRALGRMPALRNRNLRPARGTLSPPFGVALDSPKSSPGHITWWIPESPPVPPHTIFSVVK